MGICEQFNCIHLRKNSSESDIEAGNYCSESQGSDGHYTWRTPLFMNDCREIWDNCSNQMAIHDPQPSEIDGSPMCAGYKKMEFQQ